MKSLEIKKLRVAIGGTRILQDVSLSMAPREIHAIMGPNGSGKSTFAATIMGRPDCAVQSGSIRLFGKEIRKLDPEKRAHAGLFMSFQHPVEVPGLSTEHFLRTAYNTTHPRTRLGPVEFRTRFEMYANRLRISIDLARRFLNEGFSGGERKKLEVLQMLVLEPRVVVLDEIDSGLDVDALKLIAQAIRARARKGTSVLLITHYARILKYLKPDRVHILIGGTIVKSGRAALANAIERRGYEKSVDGTKIVRRNS
ncbi:MAG: Fe-S cluster assembly ATPase SufC [Patescibacteria group bacterium]|nr:Fe-S cluster assembly ATPase SufC [Patescibacteria group bacterium]MDD5715743.1 Fe-S cluster assembly ATPase SufC [Patescibacteria group bacterium]